MKSYHWLIGTSTSVVDRQCFYADPDLNFHVDTDPNLDPNPDRHKNIAHPHLDPTRSFTHAGKSDIFTFSHSIASLQCFLFLVSDKTCHIFQYFGHHIDISGKKFVYQLFHLLGIDTVRTDPDRHALIPIRQNDADTDPDPEHSQVT
jgi:hypothetical protein